MAAEDYRNDDGTSIYSTNRKEQQARSEQRWTKLKAEKGFTEISRTINGVVIFEHQGKVYYLGLMKMVYRLRGASEWLSIDDLV